MRQRVGAAIGVVALTACTSAPPAQTICETTVAMAEELANDGAISQGSVDRFIAVAPEVRDPQLRDAAAAAAAALATDPSSATDPLGAVFDRCIELDDFDGSSEPAS